jgi:hypothetical protein
MAAAGAPQDTPCSSDEEEEADHTVARPSTGHKALPKAGAVDLPGPRSASASLGRPTSVLSNLNASEVSRAACGRVGRGQGAGVKGWYAWWWYGHWWRLAQEGQGHMCWVANLVPLSFTARLDAACICQGFHP